MLGVRISGYVWLQKISIPRHWSAITLAKGTSLDVGVILLANGSGSGEKIVIKGAYLNRHTMIDAHERVEIEEGCMIGPYCYITDSDHGTQGSGCVDQNPMHSEPVKIMSGAWIGAGVKILKGVTIGRGAVIGAGAVVTKDIPDDAIAAGVPAKVIGQRSQSVVNNLSRQIAIT